MNRHICLASFAGIAGAILAIASGWYGFAKSNKGRSPRLRHPVALALVGVVPAKATIVRWNELIKKAEDRQ